MTLSHVIMCCWGNNLGFRLLWTEEDDEESWEVQLAKRYHDKLFKEYVIIDLSR